MTEVRFQVDGHQVRGWLEQVVGRAVGVKLPFHEGLTHIGTGNEGACEYAGREALQGVVEQSQVLIRVAEDEAWVTDATSTNQSGLVRREHAEQYLADPVKAEATVLPIPHEAFDTTASERRWQRIHSGDLLVHPYGIWVVKFGRRL